MSEQNTNQVVKCGVDENGIATITINRPESLNALNLEVKNFLENAFLKYANDESVRVIILTGAENVFVAGTDVSEMVDMSASDHRELRTGAVFEAIRACPKPIIAAVERYALGGGFELALACDIIIAGENAKFGQPEINVGIMPGAGGTQLLLRTIGKYQTMKLVLTGEHIKADRAFQSGLISEVVEEGESYESALNLAGKLARKPELSLVSIKEAVKQGFELPLSGALAFERKLFELLFDSSGQEEGMRAFLEKRKPEYIK